MSFTSKPVCVNPINVPASTTENICDFKITGPGSRSLRVEVFTGKVGGTGDLKLQHSAGYGLYEDVATEVLAASTDNTVTFDTDASTAGDASHGLSEDSPIVFNTSDSLPSPLEAGKIYYVKEVDSDNFKIKESVGNSTPLDLSGGSGTHTWTSLGVVSFQVQETVTADQAKTPLRPVGRIQAVMSTAETCQICAVHVVQAST